MKDVLKTLPTGPKAYDYAYEEAMKRIEGHDADSEELAKQVLSWITCSKRPLSTSELQHALAVEVGKTELDEENLPQLEDMVSVCAGLVIVDKESSIIRLVHYTTQEYFERTQRRWFPDAQTNTTTICVSYLSFDEFESGICQNDKEFRQRLQSNKLYDYASKNWGLHAREASTSCQGVMEFLQKQTQVEASYQALMAGRPWYGYRLEVPKQMTGLHLAAYFGLQGIVQRLLDCDADVKAANSEGETPLFQASQNGHLEVVRLLLDRGADVNTAASYGQTPLHLPTGHVELVRLLLHHGADIKAVDSDGQTPLYQASENGHLEVVRLLLDYGADVKAANFKEETPLFLASENGHLEVVRLLLDRGADVKAVDSDGQTPLYQASENGHLEVVRLLLDRGADVKAADSYGRTPLHQASMYKYIDITQLLLDRGADIKAVDSDGETPLYQASENGYLEVVRLLLDGGADIKAADSNGETPLYQASRNGYLEVVQLLLNRDINVNAANKKGQTPLYQASTIGHVKVVKLLLEKGADVELKNDRGRTPLSIAASNGKEAVVKLLLATSSVEPDSRDKIGRTPLFYGAMNGNTTIVKLLLATNRVDIDSRDYYNSTSLSVAARMGHRDVLALLLTRSRSLSIKDNFGRIPLWWARRTGYPEIADFLLEKHKENNIPIQEDDFPTVTISAPFDKNKRICDVCILSVSAKDTYYHCKVCYNGDFDICEECFVMEARCLDQSHMLIKEINRESV
jgi:ankyrin repeat protein